MFFNVVKLLNKDEKKRMSLLIKAAEDEQMLT